LHTFCVADLRHFAVPVDDDSRQRATKKAATRKEPALALRVG